MTNAQKGIMLDNSNHTTISNCKVYNIGSEGIHLRDNSSSCLIEDCSVHDSTTGNGGAINNAAGANVYLQNGTITANSAAAGGAIYSEGTVNIQGTLSVTGNTVTNSFEAASNLVLAKDGVINVSGAVTGSAIGVAVQEANAGRTVVKLGDAVTDVKLADVLSQITYEGDSSLKIGEDGTLVNIYI